MSARRLDDILGTHKGGAERSSSGAAEGDATSSHFVSTLFNQLVQSTRLANALPDADEHTFFLSTSTEFAKQATAMQGQLLNLLGLLSDAVTHKGESSLSRNTRSGASRAVSATFSSKKDSLDRFHQLSDTLDTALESVDLALDAHRGVKRASTTSLLASSGDGRTPRTTGFQSSSTLLKPQRQWQHLIDNSTRSWIPILTSKPNALKPLPDYEKLRQEKEEQEQKSGSSKQDDAAASSSAAADAISKGAPSPQLSPAMTSHLSSLGMSAELKSPQPPLYPHPYQFEIENMDWEAVRAQQLVRVNEQLFQPLEKVPCTWVDTVEQLEDLAEKLEQVAEIAIDLEHHSFRTYQGITCLMQISTRTADYLIDTLALRTELWRLNSSFTDPRIVKVLHGADSDILWLQRDFGLYIVNLFDTGQAARVLDLPSFGLAHLLKQFCGVTTDKKYQLADWRIRPLSAEMLLYARMDTHYLLYIYDRLKNQLIDRPTPSQNQLSPISGVPLHLAQVLERSKAVSLKTYEKDDGNSLHAAMEFAYKMGIVLQNDTQSRVLLALFDLRDSLARQEDESVFFLCSNPNLMHLIQAMPDTSAEMEAACNKPLPHMVRKHGQRVLAAIAEAKSQSSLISPFLASTLPPATSSPPLMPAMGEGATAMELGSNAVAGAAAVTPLNVRGKAMLGGSSALPPVNMTPATQASNLFAQLSTSTPQQGRAHSGHWLHDANAPLHPSQPSPVMSTEGLYHSANWIPVSSRNFEKSLAAAKNPSHATSGAAIPLFDDSGMDSSQPSARSGLTSVMSPPAKASAFSLLSTPSADSKELESNRSALAQAQASLTNTASFTHTISSLTSGGFGGAASTPLKQQALTITDDLMDLDPESAVLATPRTGEPERSFVSPCPPSLQLVQSPLTVPSGASFASIAGPVKAAAGVLANEDDEERDKVDVDAALPVSMRDIYKISNDNRRKKKKKLTHGSSLDAEDEESHSASNSAHASRSSSVVGRRDSKKLSAAELASDNGSTEFMKSIGWSSGAVPPRAHSTSVAMQMLNTQAGSSDPRKRKHSSAPASGNVSLSSSLPSSSSAFQSFDYSAATLPAGVPSQHGFFNPYADMGSSKAELKAAAGVHQQHNPANKIWKGHTQLKNANKSVTVRMDEGYAQQRQRGGSAGSGMPLRSNNPHQRR